MFIIENYIDSRRRKVESWENAREKWLRADDYRYHYEWNHPYPVVRWGKVASTAIPVILVLIVSFCGAMWIYKANQKPDEPKQPEQSVSYKNGDDCGRYKISDTGQIKYGDFEGAEVKIIGGCKKGYDVEVTKDQVLFGEGSENPEYNDKSIKKGLIFSVDSSDNLIITGHEEPEKKE